MDDIDWMTQNDLDDLHVAFTRAGWDRTYDKDVSGYPHVESWTHGSEYVVLLPLNFQLESSAYMALCASQLLYESLPPENKFRCELDFLKKLP